MLAVLYTLGLSCLKKARAFEATSVGRVEDSRRRARVGLIHRVCAERRRHRHDGGAGPEARARGRLEGVVQPRIRPAGHTDRGAREPKIRLPRPGDDRRSESSWAAVAARRNPRQVDSVGFRRVPTRRRSHRSRGRRGQARLRALQRRQGTDGHAGCVCAAGAARARLRERRRRDGGDAALPARHAQKSAAAAVRAVAPASDRACTSD